MQNTRGIILPIVFLEIMELKLGREITFLHSTGEMNIPFSIGAIMGAYLCIFECDIQ